MEEEKTQNLRPQIVVHGGYYDIHDNTFLGGTNIFGEPKGKKADSGERKLDLSDETVKHAIGMLMMGNTKSNKRWWFVPYRVLKDEGVVADLSGFKSYVMKLFGENLPIPIDTHDLSKEMDVMCFAKPVKEWSAANAPVKGTTYETYKQLILTFKEFLVAK